MRRVGKVSGTVRRWAAAGALMGVLAAAAPALACPYAAAPAAGRQTVGQTSAPHAAASVVALAQTAPRPVSTVAVAPPPARGWWSTATTAFGRWLTRPDSWIQGLLRVGVLRLTV